MSTPNKKNLGHALKQLTYGFYLLASRADSDDLKTRDKDWVSVGTVSWATQSSFNPPLITVAIQKDSNLNETIQKSQAFSLTVLGQNEEALIQRFAGGSGLQLQAGQYTGHPSTLLGWLSCTHSRSGLKPGT